MAKPEHETHKGTQTGSAGPSFGSSIGGTNDPFGMAEWLKDMPKVPLHPLMQHPAAAFAAATAVGLGMTGHIAGFMLGAMQGMAGTAQKTGAAVDEKPVVQPAEPMARDAAPATKTAAPAKASVKAKPAKIEPLKAEPVMAEKVKRQKVARVVETSADDLKRISGIGPKLEQVLNGMGIRRYADVALWSDKDVQRFDAQLGFGGRIARDGWVEQAKALMKG